MSGSRHHQARSVFVIACMTCRISKMGMSIVVCASVCQCVSVCVSQTGGEMQIQMRGSASGPTISDLGRVAASGCTAKILLRGAPRGWIVSTARRPIPLRCTCARAPPGVAPHGWRGRGIWEGLYLQLSFRVGTGSNRLPAALRCDSSLSLSLSDFPDLPYYLPPVALPTRADLSQTGTYT